jgi:single-strand selective monofunctional uracil DNA glycosylase
MSLVAITENLVASLAGLRFGPPVACVYNPLDYARDPHRQYLQRYGKSRRPVLLVGMNPGPFGMVQTGVPFGEVTMVREWLGIEGVVARPKKEHPKRPVEGFACQRSEVSGRRLWGWAAARFGTAKKFFATFYVHNYCPLAFVEASGRNVTPDKLKARERERLFAICDRALVAVVTALRPKLVVGIGGFAEQRARQAVGEEDGIVVGRMPHPSPASPQANRGWDGLADAALRGLGVALPRA